MQKRTLMVKVMISAFVLGIIWNTLPAVAETTDGIVLSDMVAEETEFFDEETDRGTEEEIGNTETSDEMALSDKPGEENTSLDEETDSGAESKPNTELTDVAGEKIESLGEETDNRLNGETDGLESETEEGFQETIENGNESLISEFSDVPSIAADDQKILWEGISGDITWKIDSNGLLSLTGVGDYELTRNGVPPWYPHAMYITSAEINITEITNTSWMFFCCNLTSLDLSNLDTSQVTDMRGMFAACGSLTDLDVTNLDTSQVTDMSNMFQGCYNLTSLDVSNLDI